MPAALLVGPVLNLQLSSAAVGFGLTTGCVQESWAKLAIRAPSFGSYLLTRQVPPPLCPAAVESERAKNESTRSPA